MDQFQQTFDSLNMSCFALAPAGPRTADTPAYCTDEDNRLSLLTGPGPFAVSRKNFRKYRNRQTPLDVEITYGGKLAITAHVTELDVLQSEPGPGRAAEKVTASRDRIPAGVMAGFALSKKNPSYPKDARKKHIAGTVVLWARITKEGTIANLGVIASPHPLLSKSATDAVLKWTYRPYLLDREPTEVDTTILVNYSLGP